MRVAAAAYPLDWLNGWQDYETKLGDWVAHAAGDGAQLLVFPEYAAMELASLGGECVAADIRGALEEAARHRAAADELHARLAARHGVHILCGSGPVLEVGRMGDRPVNRATLFSPDGPVGHQDKAIMTRWERDPWNMASGCGLNVFDTELGRIGVLICYDSEFPLLGRALAEAGAEILLVPSATETMAGFTRVRVGAMARALENQMIAVHAPIVGQAPWCCGMEENTGAASIYAPPDRGFPSSGIIAEGQMGRPGWVMADISLDAIEAVRADGGVLNLAHWPEQLAQVSQVRIIAANRDKS
ncbi:putative amidohydrolase [Albidovulum inexpectatum]|uniref:Putative amidohydrolase n=1 Tax=Albidovulum inexpectatum TaxID=196587 RepID=A0A2S5JGK8_9RHOB|nr:carbon-nitrogen hydrolase family protein [Albidovulum inexpectatum]PPB80647.1 putative amidohydrolase [Albidovulum inexpectatum]